MTKRGHVHCLITTLEFLGAELGYISISELRANGAKLDLYYTKPKTIGELLA